MDLEDLKTHRNPYRYEPQPYRCSLRPTQQINHLRQRETPLPTCSLQRTRTQIQFFAAFNLNFCSSFVRRKGSLKCCFKNYLVKNQTISQLNHRYINK